MDAVLNFVSATFGATGPFGDMGWLVLLGGAFVFIFLLWQWIRGSIRRLSALRHDITNVDNQIRFVKRANFKPRPLLGHQEYLIFQILNKWVDQAQRHHAQKGWRLFAQVSYGEILASENERAFRSINAKRADFVIVDPRGYPVMVIEYQGTGHYQGNARKRDLVKSTALHSANVAFVEIFPNEDQGDIFKKLFAAAQDYAPPKAA